VTRAHVDKPFAAACERNREPILDVLRPFFADRRHVLEIGSGTGQHAVHFAAAMPHLVWQTSERAGHLDGIRAWLDDAALSNTPAPIALDAADVEWPVARYDAVFSANTLHIMAWHEVEQLFAHLRGVTSEDAVLAVYGPFNLAGRFTSESNAAFDASLKQRAQHMGIRDLEAVDALAADAGFARIGDHALPANNRCVVWRRHP
jgi:cyclopropane fatty-acyl-phospholipid synthase-like methyltransferase